MSLPDFFIAGVPKSGTTALHVALARHPKLFMSEVKEPKYFLTDGTPPPERGGPGDARTYRQYVWQRADYEALFEAAEPGTLRGESTSLYLYDPVALRRIKDAVPDARIIVSLRDPVDRAHSNWTHLWSAGLEPERDFVSACKLEDDRVAAGWASFWRYLDLGRYGQQLSALYEIFPREQVLVLRYRELREAPVATLDKICAFLGVETGVLTEAPASNVTTHIDDSWRNRLVSQVLRAGSAVEHRLPKAWWPAIDGFLSSHLQREQKLRPAITPEQRGELISFFEADIALLESVTGETFQDWLLAGRLAHKVALKPEGRIGTAHNSIDRPLTQNKP